MRVPQLKEKPKGSQKWIQDIINICPELLNGLIQQKFTSLSGREICWKSPLKEDDFSEYRDTAFLENINLQELVAELKKFWPKNGPQWDALGRTSDGRAFILIEAKANVPEIVSSCGATDKESQKTISERLYETQRWLNCRAPRFDWKYGFYQYANRLAHLYFLREKSNKEAYLVFLYFVDDPTYKPTSQEAWNSALKLQEKLMGLSAGSLRHRGIIDLFINTSDILELPETSY
jgi:hypothetical protein